METANRDSEFQNRVLSEIEAIKVFILNRHDSGQFSSKWVPRRTVMKFLSYGPTQMAELEKAGQLVVTRIGKRKFILKSSLEKLLDANKI